jgi:hypothetical protein
MIEIRREKPTNVPENEDLVGGFVEISLQKPDDFLRIKETLTRIGVASRKNNTLWQSCHILHKRGKYYLVHFLEMFLLDGKEANLTNKDIGRRNRIAQMLEEWSLLSVVNPDVIKSPIVPFHEITVIPYKTKHMWTLVPKYSIGK